MHPSLDTLRLLFDPFAQPQNAAAKIKQPWLHIAKLVENVRNLRKGKEYGNAVDEMVVVMRKFIPIMEEEIWVLPIAYFIANDLRKLATIADARKDNEINTTEEQEQDDISGYRGKAATSIQEVFKVCLNDRSGKPLVSPREANAKIQGVYFFACILFKIYLQLENISLFKHILRPMASLPQITNQSIETWPRTHRVMWMYYTGLFSFWNEDYKMAHQKFQYAFESISASSKNKRLLMDFLVPLSLLSSGKLPAKSDPFYDPLIKSVRSGDLTTFNLWCDANEKKLLEAGTFLVVERCKEIVWRRLVKKIWRLLESPPRFPLNTLQGVLTLQGHNKSIDEVECVVANMIAKGLIKGYISHEHRIIVLSKAVAFPSIQSLPNGLLDPL